MTLGEFSKLFGASSEIIADYTGIAPSTIRAYIKRIREPSIGNAILIKKFTNGLVDFKDMIKVVEVRNEELYEIVDDPAKYYENEGRLANIFFIQNNFDLVMEIQKETGKILYEESDIFKITKVDLKKLSKRELKAIEETKKAYKEYLKQEGRVEVKPRKATHPS